jgi:hypothetical protein
MKSLKSGKVQPMKRPAAKKGLKDQCAEWQMSVKAIEEGAIRDKGKGIKFAKMKDQLPSHILHMYDVEAKNHSSPREFRTMIINKLFNKEDDGRFTLNVKEPFFEEHRHLYEKKFGKDTNKAVPKSIMVGLYFQGSEPSFQRAVDCGDVEEIEDNGKLFYSFRELKTGTARAAVKSQAVGSGRCKITKEEFHDMKDVVDNLGWSFKMTTVEQKQLLANPKMPLPDQVIASFNQAKAACEKLEKQAMHILKKLSGDSPHKV